MTIFNLVLDIFVFIFFLVANNPRLTGNNLHEWVSLALGAALLVHLLVHWRWVANVVPNFFRKLARTSRLNFVVDLLLLVAFITVSLSGVLISEAVAPALGLAVTRGGVWKVLHSRSADLAFILMAVHFALHWQWFVCVIKRYIFLPIAARIHPSASTPRVPADGADE